MKCKSLCLVLLPAVLAGCAVAQESRQDISLSATGLLKTDVSGGAITQAKSNMVLGGLASYRFMLTPRSALEVNYQYSQMAFHYSAFPSARVASRYQEISGAYVYSRNYGNWNPFVEGGVGGFIFSPLQNGGTTTYSVSQNTNIGALYGVGVAYQISPSFDVRAEYRGLILKYPSFNQSDFRTGVYANFSNPAIGVAYHF
jgi:opacity protein-like surface antigen